MAALAVHVGATGSHRQAGSTPRRLRGPRTVTNCPGGARRQCPAFCWFHRTTQSRSKKLRLFPTPYSVFGFPILRGQTLQGCETTFKGWVFNPIHPAVLVQNDARMKFVLFPGAMNCHHQECSRNKRLHRLRNVGVESAQVKGRNQWRGRGVSPHFFRQHRLEKNAGLTPTPAVTDRIQVLLPLASSGVELEFRPDFSEIPKRRRTSLSVGVSVILLTSLIWFNLV